MISVVLVRVSLDVTNIQRMNQFLRNASIMQTFLLMYEWKTLVGVRKLRFYLITHNYGVWKSQKKSHSTLRAKRATFTFWVDKIPLKMPKIVNFWKTEAHGQTVLPERSLLIGQTLVENAKTQKYKCDIFWDFHTLVFFLSIVTFLDTKRLYFTVNLVFKIRCCSSRSLMLSDNLSNGKH